jgi:hypothetical protein
VARFAETVLDMARGTWNGPTRLGPFSFAVMAACTIAPVVGPPEPATRPVRSFEISALRETGILDRLLHREIGVGRTVAHEAHQAAVDQLLDVELQGAGDLAAEAQVAILRHELDARLAFLQRLRDLGGVVADRGDDAEARDDDAPHQTAAAGGAASFTRPTFMSIAS